LRTTVTLDPDVDAALRRLARERGVSFKEVLNETLRAGLGARAQPPKRYRLRPRRLGLRPGIDLDRALQLAAAMEDEATARELELRK
jgi:hypothetical protein